MKRLKELLGKTLSGKQQGAALVVTLLVMLVLVLLGLSIILQSQTEYTIATNEQDAFTALGYGEATLERLNRAVRDYALSTSNPTDLDDFLNGVNNNNTTYNIPDLTPDRTLDLSGTVTLKNMTFANETTTSVKVQKDFGDGSGSQDYEAFRVGDDTDHNGSFDGRTRGLVYVRVDDNYDTGTTPDVDDNDWRMRGRVIVEYPRWIESDGTLVDQNDNQVRTVAVRKLVANFAPAGQYAIRTDGDLDIGGDLQLCGECGGAHANGTLAIDLGTGGYNCSELSGTGGLTITDPSGLIAPAVLTGPVFIPQLNPYDDRYVPAPSTFDHRTDAPISQLACPGPTVTDSNWWLKDPGAFKYFALTLRKVNGVNRMRIYKAYWDNTNNHWVWRLIDEGEGNPPVMHTLLDNCGRVVGTTNKLYDDDADATNDVMLSPDPIPDATDTGPSGYWGTGGRPAWVGVAKTDDDDRFYGFDVAHNQGYDTTECNTDKSLQGTDYNDFTKNDFWRTSANPFSVAVPYVEPTDYTRNSTITAFFGATEDPFTPNETLDVPLPGTVHTYLTALTTATNGDSQADLGVTPNDARRDFVYSQPNDDTNNSSKWSFKGTPTQDVPSPMWGAVLFIYGNLDMNAGSNLQYVNDAGAQVSLGFSDPALDSRWRISLIVYNYAELHGNPIYGPASTSFQVGVVAGRDITMHGTGGSSHGGQDTCPTGSDCTATPPAGAGFEGMFLAHEEVLFTGNVQVNGFIIAEDAANCVEASNTIPPNIAGGSVQIHYDCENPPDPWGDNSVSIASWEEVQ